MARKREQVTITPDPGVVEWVDANVGPGKRFYNRTHAFEYAVAYLRENEVWAPRVSSTTTGLTPGDNARASEGTPSPEKVYRRPASQPKA